MGIAIHHEMAQRIRKKYPYPFYVVKEGMDWGRGISLPDVVVFDGLEKNPLVVYAIKSFSISPYRMRAVTGTNHARTIYAKDIRPELAYAKKYSVPCFLVIYNSRNWELEPWKCRMLEIPIDPNTFDHYTSPPEFALDAEEPTIQM